MKLKLMAVMFAVVFGGCALTVGDDLHKQAPGVSKKVFPSSAALAQAKVGMTPEEVLALTGQDVVIGYEMIEQEPFKQQVKREIIFKNPYRSQQLSSGGKNIRVDFYLTQIRLADGMISDNELTPVVFENERLAGVGWEFWDKKKADHLIP